MKKRILISCCLGSIVKWFINKRGHARFTADAFSPILDAVYESPRARLFDYVGVDYHDPFMAHLFRLPDWWDHELKNKSLRSREGDCPSKTYSELVREARLKTVGHVALI